MFFNTLRIAVGAKDNTGDLTLEDVDISNRRGNSLWVTNHSGDITLDGVEISNTGNENGEIGAKLNNTAGTGDVTIDDSSFDKNRNAGLIVESKGEITLKDVSASGNQNGAKLDNTAGTDDVTIEGSDFDENKNAGLFVESNGEITLKYVSASRNRSNNKEGAYLKNDTSTTDDNGDHPGVTIENSDFNGNARASGLIVESKGDIILKYVSADNNGNGKGENGAHLTNDKGNSSNYPSVRVTNSTFDNNAFTGLNVISRGDITLRKVTAVNNGIHQVFLDNRCGTGDIMVRYGTFNSSRKGTGKDTGLTVLSSRNITIKWVRASGHGNNGADLSNGADLNNPFGFGFIKVAGSTFRANKNNGLVASSNSEISLCDVIASRNGANGVGLLSTIGGIKICHGNFSGNSDSGLVAGTVLGNISLRDITARRNGLYGVKLTSLGGDINICSGDFTGNNTNNAWGIYNIKAFTLSDYNLGKVKFDSSIFPKIKWNMWNVGLVCRPTQDSDSDGVPDCSDKCPDFNDNHDFDKDGVPNLCDRCNDNLDRDRDNISDCVDPCDDRIDSDGDNIPDCTDPCDDNIDSDGDGTSDCKDTCDDRLDRDGDGISDCKDICDDRIDTDGDGISDCKDTCDDRVDTDGDGMSDCNDGCPGDGDKTAPGVCGCGVAEDACSSPPGDVQVDLTGGGCALVELLVNDDAARFCINSSGDRGRLDRLNEAGITAVPVGSTFESAMMASVFDGETPVFTLIGGDKIKLLFDVPDGMEGETFMILYWDPAANGGLGDWTELGGTVVGGQVVATVNFTGVFVLVTQ